MKEELKEIIREEVMNYNEYYDLDYVFINIFERIKYEDFVNINYTALYEAENDELIYTYDQWEIMKYYQTPTEANYNEALLLFEEDLVNIYYKISERVVKGL